MNILSFDTSLNKTYLSISINDNIYSKTIESTDDKYHSAFLIKKIVEMLNTHNLTPQDINVIVTNIGPGSFTGIRVGLTVARTLAQAINADCIGINSLELISETYNLPAITVLDARKNKAYIGNNEKVDLIDLDNLPEILKNSNSKIIADTKMQAYLKESNIESTNFEIENKDYGKSLIYIAMKKLKESKACKWQNLKPLYIQPPPIHQKKSLEATK